MNPVQRLGLASVAAWLVATSGCGAPKVEARKDNRDQTPTMNVSGDPSHTVVVYGVKAR